MVGTVGPQLPRGRHRLSREEVVQSQRLRIALGVAESVRDKGYVGTSVADIIKLAGVSRETFYQHHTDKLDAFLAAVDYIGTGLHARMVGAIEGPGTPLERFERALTDYLGILADQPGYARLVLVETHAAGPAALARRAAIQRRIADTLADLFGARSTASRLTCEMFIAAVAAMVTLPVVAGNAARVRALRPDIIDQLRLLHAAGLLTSAQPPA